MLITTYRLLERRYVRRRFDYPIARATVDVSRVRRHA